MNTKKDLTTYVVFGAGPAGLMAAHTLLKNGKKVVLLEVQGQVGGLAKTLQKGSLKYDLGPHNLHSIYPDIVKLIKDILDNQIEEHKIVSMIYFRGRIVPYPLTGMRVFTSIPLSLAIMASMDFMFTRLKRRLSLCSSEDASFKDWIINRFGSTLYKIYFKPYASKVWKIDPDDLSSMVAAKRIPVLSLFGIMKDVLLKKKKFHPEDSTQIYNFYPKGGVGVLMRKIEEDIRKMGGEIVCGAVIEKVLCVKDSIFSISYKDQNGKLCEIANPRLISSIPLNNLIALLSGIDPKVQERAQTLSYCSTRLFYLTVAKKEVLSVPWIYFSDTDVIFNRLSDMSRFSKTLVADNKTILCLEISCRINDELWKATDEEIYEKVIPVLEKYKLLLHEDIEGFFSEFITHSYPLFARDFEKALAASLNAVAQIEGLITIGRQGLFAYSNIDDSIRMGIIAANLIGGENRKIGYKEIFGNYLFY